MKIYLFRHAQKAMDFSGDPDLTSDGFAQANKLLDRILKNEMPQPTSLWVSPKKRTHSTFREVSRALELPLQIHEELSEQKAEETLQDFRKRIQHLFEAASRQNAEVVFMCSHYDLVVEAMTVLPCDKDLQTAEFAQWAPCQFIGLETSSDGIFKFLEFKRI